MFSTILLAAAEAHDAAAHAAGESEGIVSTFGLDPKYVAVQLISFLILFGVLYWKGIKPTIVAMEARQSKIEAGVKDADAMKLKLEAAYAESAAIIKAAHAEGTKSVEEARKTAKEFLDRQTQEASAKAADMLTKAQHAIELEHRKMVAEARSEIARLVVTTTQQVLAQELTAEDRSRYNTAATKALNVA